MTQLILNNITMPHNKDGGYRAYEEDLSVSVQMASGRMVRESRGKVWIVEYSYDHAISDQERKDLISMLRGGIIQAQFLPDAGDALVSGEFLCTTQPKPKYVFDRGGVPVWRDLSFVLREVSPHD